MLAQLAQVGWLGRFATTDVEVGHEPGAGFEPRVYVILSSVESLRHRRDGDPRMRRAAFSLWQTGVDLTLEPQFFTPPVPPFRLATTGRG